MNLQLVLSDDVLQAIAERAAELVLHRLTAGEVDGAAWPEWMSVETAARYLDVSEERLRKLKERSAIPHFQEGPGCRIFFQRQELDAWMEASRQVGRR